MPRRSLGPRLYLDPQDNRFCIRDGTAKKRLPFGPDRETEAELALDEYRRGVAPAPLHGFVYFVTADYPEYPIKIGTTQRRFTRFSSLQGACPYRLYVAGIVEGDALLERRLHKQFARLRLEGEWFQRAPELIATLGRLCADHATEFRLERVPDSYSVRSDRLA